MHSFPTRRSSDLFIVHVDCIDPLVEETEESGNWRTGGQRVAVTPHDILEDARSDPGRPVRCLAFVGATRGGPAGLQQIHPNILLREIIARRTTCFEQEPGWWVLALVWSAQTKADGTELGRIRPLLEGT